MAYYNQCPYCKANLDPGEKCDCDKTEIKEENKIIHTIKKIENVKAKDKKDKDVDKIIDNLWLALSGKYNREGEI